MEREARPKILLYQSIGFLSVIGLAWLDDRLGLSALILGDDPHLPSFHASLLEVLFALVVWLLVNGATRRMLARMKYLEGFMRVCAWCRRVDYRGRWMPFEQFLQQGFDTPTTHGICDECLAREKKAAELARRRRMESANGGAQSQKA